MPGRNGQILTIDQGTTNTKVSLVDSRGVVIAQSTRPMAQRYPQPAWVEQDAASIWHSVRDAIDSCLDSTNDPQPVAIAITNQRESVTLWERDSGRPNGPVISWQCRRTAEFCARLRDRGLAPLLAERTGLTVDPLFSASKMRWLLDYVEDGQHRAEQGQLCLGTVDSWLLWNLTGGREHACDLTNASRTQLFDIHTLQWSEDLLQLFGVPLAALPELRPSSGSFGVTVAMGSLEAGIPIASLIGDSHASFFGQGGRTPGTVKATYGTGSSLMTATRAPVLSKRGLSTTVAWALDREQVTYALEGNISMTGSAVQWLGEFMGVQDGANGVAELAESVEDSRGVYMVPALVGLGAPYWDDTARGLICGLTPSSTPAHLARAAIEAIAYQVRDVLDAMGSEASDDLEILLADGGASRNNQLMQFQADIINRPVLRNTSAETSSLGAAYLAGLATGVWETLDEIDQLPKVRERFDAQMSNEHRTALYLGWQTAVSRTTHSSNVL